MARKKEKGKDNPNTAFTAEEPQEQPPTQPTHQPTRSRTSKQAVSKPVQKPTHQSRSHAPVQDEDNRPTHRSSCSRTPSHPPVPQLVATPHTLPQSPSNNDEEQHVDQAESSTRGRQITHSTVSFNDDNPFFTPSTGPIIKEEMQNPKFEVQIYEFSSSNTNLWKHMLEHLPEWIAHCDAHGYTIDAKCVNEEVALYRQENDMLTALATLKIEKFSVEGLIARLEELIIAEDLPIAFMESEHVINVILYLQRDLTKDDIPGQTTMTKIILDTYRAHMYELTVELKTALGKISFTCDGWTDNLLYPFIAITAHWIQEVTVIQKSGKGVVSQTVLKLHANVIAFHELPVSHTGVHLGEAFLYLLGRLGLTKKIGWVTCDNATNNDGMFHRLHKRLQMTNIDFHWYHNHIRCFAHIIHLAITAILDKMDAIDLAEIFANREGVSLPGGRSGVCWASSQRQIAFETLVRQARNRQELLLVQDITNCWSSSHNMLKRAIILHPQLEEFKLDQNHGQDIAPHILNKYEWMAVEVCEHILGVPHAFQHVLSIEETPCLAFTIPAFHAVIDNWQVLQDNDPDFYAIIKQGIKKLDDYLEHIRDVPAYFLSMWDRLVDAEFTYVQHGGKDAYKASYIFFNNIISETYLNIDLSTGF
uniref:Uncharacterized protein n=1 Tax=Moniliophthora roreri TaxID=221103 RepID=A0A0W0FNI4_MONRR